MSPNYQLIPFTKILLIQYLNKLTKSLDLVFIVCTCNTSSKMVVISFQSNTNIDCLINKLPKRFNCKQRTNNKFTVCDMLDFLSTSVICYETSEYLIISFLRRNISLFCVFRSKQSTRWSLWNNICVFSLIQYKNELRCIILISNIG